MNTTTQNALSGNVLEHDAPSAPHDADENRDVAALSYILPLSFLVFLFAERSKFMTFHAKQGMVLMALTIVAWLLPIGGTLLSIAVIAYAVYGFFGAAQGKWIDLMLIGPLSRGDWAALRESAHALWRRAVSTLGGVKLRLTKNPPSAS